jgi:ESCRT-II complex subunit VPS36
VNILRIQSKAKEMMELAKMRQKLLTNQSNSNNEEMGSKQDMQDLLLSVGIVSPVTKETAGALYHQQLSRQVICARS